MCGSWGLGDIGAPAGDDLPEGDGRNNYSSTFTPDPDSEDGFYNAQYFNSTGKKRGVWSSSE